MWEPALLAMAVGRAIKISADLTPSLAGLAPTGDLWLAHEVGGLTQNIVGAGLPAMAVGQAISMLNVPASSLASQLPQGFVV